MSKPLPSLAKAAVGTFSPIFFGVGVGDGDSVMVGVMELTGDAVFDGTEVLEVSQGWARSGV